MKTWRTLSFTTPEQHNVLRTAEAAFDVIDHVE